jgi:flavin reductase (DIM6/NTAB) family NADH-FMN oxidoreductase RutF/DNA-binding IclR family transcriptional regulator
MEQLVGLCVSTRERQMPQEYPNIDPDLYRQVLGQYPTGVVVVTADIPGGNPAALTIGSFSSVSLDPPLVGFYPDKGSSSWPMIRERGSFVVNILSSDQETVCRSFARRGGDKFEGVEWRPASSGAPVIEGAVALLECELEAVHEAGDHFHVLARVRHLQIESGSLPLVFFRGGYGRFAPSSLVTAESGLLEYLPTVDRIRPELEAISRDLKTEVLLAAHVRDEFVMLAGAGPDSSKSAVTRVGRRLPYMAPLGLVFAAWGAEEEFAHWLDPHGQLTAEDHESWLKTAEVVRSQGYVVGMGDQSYSELEQTFSRQNSRYSPPDVTLRTAVQNVRDGLAQQAELLDGVEYDLRSLAAPIFTDHGVMQIGLYGFTGTTDGGTVRAYAERLVAGARHGTDVLRHTFS